MRAAKCTCRYPNGVGGHCTYVIDNDIRGISWHLLSEDI